MTDHRPSDGSHQPDRVFVGVDSFRARGKRAKDPSPGPATSGSWLQVIRARTRSPKPAQEASARSKEEGAERDGRIKRQQVEEERREQEPCC